MFAEAVNMNKKGAELSLNVVIIAAIALIVLIILVFFFTGRIGGLFAYPPKNATLNEAPDRNIEVVGIDCKNHVICYRQKNSGSMSCVTVASLPEGCPIYSQSSVSLRVVQRRCVDPSSDKEINLSFSQRDWRCDETTQLCHLEIPFC